MIYFYLFILIGIVACRVLILRCIHVLISVKLTLWNGKYPSIALWILGVYLAKQNGRIICPSLFYCTLEALLQTADVIDTSILAPELNTALVDDGLTKLTSTVGCQLTHCSSCPCAVVRSVTGLDKSVQQLLSLSVITLHAVSLCGNKIHLLNTHEHVVAQPC